MAQTNANKNDIPADQKPKAHQLSPDKKLPRTLWIISLVFIAFVTIVFLTEHRGSIDWVEDYNAGMKLAKQKNKPVLLCFYKKQTHFCSEMWQMVYSKPSVQEYVEANFIPVLIDVDKQPEIARRYDVSYYPTHYVENPNTNQIDGPFLGAFRLFEFISKPREFSQKNSSSQ